MCSIAIAALVPVFQATAWESYHDPNQADAGYCASCHNGFAGGQNDTLHFLHTGDNGMTADCSLCHTGSGRDNPLLMWSQGNNLGCMGCHGQDYGETIKADYRGFAITGLHKNSGYGLRRHHARSGITVCATCHTNDVNVAPYPENVIDPGLGFTVHYYSRTASVGLGGLPINPCNNEDSVDDVDTRGLDNDGDGVYDSADPDCTGAPVTLKLQTTSTNTTLFSWPATFDGWHLQVNSTLGSANWTNLPNVPRETTNGLWTIVLPPQPSQHFYRLNKRF